VFSTMTYTFVIASLFGTVCLTQPVVDNTVMPTVEQVYKVGTNPQTEYYQPVYWDAGEATPLNSVKTNSTSLYETLLNES